MRAKRVNCAGAVLPLIEMAEGHRGCKIPLDEMIETRVKTDLDDKRMIRMIIGMRRMRSRRGSR